MLSYSKLRKEYIPYEAKRKLLQSYDYFVADERSVVVILLTDDHQQ